MLIKRMGPRNRTQVLSFSESAAVWIEPGLFLWERRHGAVCPFLWFCLMFRSLLFLIVQPFDPLLPLLWDIDKAVPCGSHYCWLCGECVMLPPAVLVHSNLFRFWLEKKRPSSIIERLKQTAWVRTRRQKKGFLQMWWGLTLSNIICASGLYLLIQWWHV